MKKGATYKGAGVDIDEGARLVDLIKPLAKSTKRAGVMDSIGGFGALFSGNFKGMRSPILVSSTDGVGTKLNIAFQTGIHDTIGIDLVAMCVNDILTLGAEPLFFLDYFSTSSLNAQVGREVVKGIAKGCKDSGCALVGGETAEMPGLYKKGEYDLAGFSVGVVDKGKVVDGSKIKSGHVIIGLPSSGLHSNGYSLARHVLLNGKGKLSLNRRYKGLRLSLGRELLRPTKLYTKAVLSLLKRVDVTAMAHITGGGLVDNLPRVLPGGLKAVIDASSWKVPQIFKMIEERGGVERTEMLRTFNYGIGYVIIVRPKDLSKALKSLERSGERGVVIGTVKRAAKGSGNGLGKMAAAVELV